MRLKILAEVLEKVEEEFQILLQLLVLEIVSFFSGCIYLLCVFEILPHYVRLDDRTVKVKGSFCEGKNIFREGEN